MPLSEEIDRKGDPIVAMTSTISSNLIRLNLSDLWMHPNSFGCGVVGALSVPRPKELDRGTLRKLIKLAGLTVDEFVELL